MTHAVLRARILASLGLGTLGAPSVGCTRQAADPIDVVVSPARLLEVDAAMPERDVPNPVAVRLPPDWRAVDGGYMHTVVSQGPSQIVRDDTIPHEYSYSVRPTLTRIEVFSALPPEPQRWGISESGGGCPPQHFCVDVAGSSVPGAAAAAMTARCPSQPPRGVSELRYEGWRVALDRNLTRSERTDYRGNVCCYTKSRPCGGGRLLLHEGQPRLPKTETYHDRKTPPRSVAIAELSEQHRAQLAAHWAHEASFEHASVASFNHALSAMIALDAPASLLAWTASAADDEVTHARMLYDLASEFAGYSLGPAPLANVASAHATIESFARSLYVEACVNETLAIAHTQRILETAQLEPVINEVLARIVCDELTHMDLAWRTLGWCLSVGGEGVRAAIAEELAQLVAQCPCGGDDDPSNATLTDHDALLTRWGVLPASSVRSVRDATLRKVIVPCTSAALNRSITDGDSRRSTSPLLQSLPTRVLF